MLLEILILVLTTILCYYIYSYKRIHSHFKENGIKFKPGVPLFGNVLGLTFLKKHFIDELDDIYNAFPNERYVAFQEFTMPVILVRDPELIKNIVVKDFEHFTDHRPFFSEEQDPLFAGSLLLMKGEKWRLMRTTLSPAFTSSKMKNMLPLMLDITNNIVEYLYEQQGQDIDVDDLMRRYTNDVIASAAFGLQVNSLKDRENDFYKMGNGLFDFSLRQRLLLILSTQFPEFVKKLGFRVFPDKAYKFFSNIVATSIEYRKKEKVERPDMIQLLIETKREWTLEELAGQVFIFFFAGFETSASVLVMTIHELALNFDIQDKLYQECKRYKGDKVISFENLTNLKYLDAVINGVRFGMMTLKMLLYNIVLNLKIVKTSKTSDPIKLKPNNFNIKAVNGTFVQFEKRIPN